MKKKDSVYDRIKDEDNNKKSSTTNDVVKALFSQRVIAFIIDIFIVSFFGILVNIFIPVNDTALKLYNEQDKIMENYQNGLINMEEYVNQLVDISYDISKHTVIISIVAIIINLVYYVIYPCYNNGQTLGKKIMKIKIKKVNDSELTMNNLLIRAMINNSIFINILNIIFVLVLNKELFLMFSSVFGVVQYGILIVSVIMIAFTAKSQGIHDKICKTEVVVVDIVKEDLLCMRES